MEVTPYCRFIDRERRSETVQTPIGFLTLSASGNRMVAKLAISEDLVRVLESDEQAFKKRAGALLQHCSEEVAERIRTMFEDAQLMGKELARRAEYFGHLFEAAAQIPENEKDTERFNELLILQMNTLKFLSSAIPVTDTGSLAYDSFGGIADENPLPYALFEAIIIKAFTPREQSSAPIR